MNAQSAREWLLERQVCTRPYGLARMEFLVDALDRPQEQVPSVLIGGTNGKGSVTTILESILRCTEIYAVGSLTSPHLRNVTERIKIQGRPLADKYWRQGLELLQKTYRVMEKDESVGPASFFELVTALALWAFRETERDVVFLEVGLGGRLDATNVAAPEISVITNVGSDHQDLLGSDRIDIAKEKLGILRRKRPLITGERDPQILSLFAEECRKNGSQLITVERDSFFSVLASTPQGHRLRLNASEAEVFFPLAGRHQLDNLRIALTVIEKMREHHFEIDSDAVEQGIRQSFWPGRLQWVPGTPDVLLDGAHNEEGIATLIDYLQKFPPKRPLQIILGILANKPAQSMAKHLAPLGDRLSFVPPPIGRAIGHESFTQRILATDPRWTWFDHLDQALAATTPEGTVLISGSLYLVGDYLQRFAPSAMEETTSLPAEMS